MISQREASDVHKVSSLLHTLRGEAFRHRRNILGARAYVPVRSTAQGPSLPPLSSNYVDPDEHLQDPRPAPSLPTLKVPGPSPPRSWTHSGLSSTTPTPEWRIRALSLILRYSRMNSPALTKPSNDRTPSLFQLCLHSLVKWGGIPPELFSELPRHILREYVRYTAVHAPGLPRTDLETLWSVDNAGSADGEIIISGLSPAAILPRLATAYTNSTTTSEWDTPCDVIDPDLPPAPHTLIILTSLGSLSPNVMASLPPTLTHLALLLVPPVTLHKLPALLPLLKVLDVSFNTWAKGASLRVEWRKWVHLEVLGLRECGLEASDIQAVEVNVNHGRLREVDIIVE